MSVELIELRQFRVKIKGKYIILYISMYITIIGNLPHLFFKSEYK